MAVSRLVGLLVVCIPRLFFLFLLLLLQSSFPGAVGMLAPRVGVLHACPLLPSPPQLEASREKRGGQDARYKYSRVAGARSELSLSLAPRSRLSPCCAVVVGW